MDVTQLPTAVTTRKLNFDLSIAPNEDSRTEGGGFAQLALDVSDHFAIDAGVRADSFSNIENDRRVPAWCDPVSSDRQTGPRDQSWLRSRVPHAVADQQLHRSDDLQRRPRCQQGRSSSRAPWSAIRDLVEERNDQIEIGYRGAVNNGKFSWDIAVYRAETKDSLDFFVAGLYTFFNQPPGYPTTLQCLLPGAPVPAMSPPGFPGAVQLPSLFSYRNVGKTINKGFEVGLRLQPIARNTLVVNYSYQQDPEIEGRSRG